MKEIQYLYFAGFLFMLSQSLRAKLEFLFIELNLNYIISFVHVCLIFRF